MRPPLNTDVVEWGVPDWLSRPSGALSAATVTEGAQEEDSFKSFHRHKSSPRSSVFQHRVMRILVLIAVCDWPLISGVVTDLRGC